MGANVTLISYDECARLTPEVREHILGQFAGSPRERFISTPRDRKNKCDRGPA